MGRGAFLHSSCQIVPFKEFFTWPKRKLAMGLLTLFFRHGKATWLESVGVSFLLKCQGPDTREDFRSWLLPLRQCSWLCKVTMAPERGAER